nr:hypothetical protein [Polymorphobacter sp.]
MPLKSAQIMSADVGDFLVRAREALRITEAFQKRLVDDAEFAALWDRDSAAALKAAGIDPEARQAMGFGPYDEGAQCNWCITPNGNSCHC